MSVADSLPPAAAKNHVPRQKATRTLADLPIGALARVAHIAGDDEISLRLMEMGLVPGTDLKIVGVAPLGDPIEIELRGYRLSLRRSEASRVQLLIGDC